MWKESYRMGVDAIDRQHMALFDMTERLLEAIKKPGTLKLKKECEEAILFMKNYVIEHFNDEEEYQKSIQYAGFTEHRQAHQEFTSDVLRHEKKMASSNFDISDVKDFAGMVAAWLTYHVADADQKIVISERPQKIVIDSFSTAICATLKTMTHINKEDIKLINSRDDFEGDIAITVDLTGDVPCTVGYVFTKEFVFNLIKSFLFLTVNSLDSFTCSILLEIANIISKNAAFELVKAGVRCNISAPVIRLKPPLSCAKEFFVFDTRMGKLEIEVCI